MIIYLLAFVGIVCTIFGLSYSEDSTPLIVHPQSGDEGDHGNATRSSQQSVEISSEGMEEARSDQLVEDVLKNDQYQLERKILEQKLRAAAQIGLSETVWPHIHENDSKKVMEDIINQKYPSETSTASPQKITRENIINMIKYEKLKEAMMILRDHQEKDGDAKSNVAKTQIEAERGVDGRASRTFQYSAG